MRVGIIGTGNISSAYLRASERFPQIAMVACADLRLELARKRAAEFSLRAEDVEALLQDAEIDVVLNLTTPASHVPINLAALQAGKHVYSEKPFGTSLAQARPVIDLAANTGLRVGSAPDTFLGAAYQTARKLIDDGAIGQPLGGWAFFLSSGPESWHPNPDFFYQPGAGPVFDMGPYYVTALVSLFGPVRNVFSIARTAGIERVIGSGARQGESFTTEVPTTVLGLLQFASGPVIHVGMSFDAPLHEYVPIRLYGSEGALELPDPNWFGGNVRLARKGQNWKDVSPSHAYGDFNYRSLGLAEMITSIGQGRLHRASGELAFHVLEVLEKLTLPEAESSPVPLSTTCSQPRPLSGYSERPSLA
ncbi:MAG TPA: Gfo/Idh/MocA family oxidoreductase [Chthoniobacterales bacterium]